jgi:hypothetical protein
MFTYSHPEIYAICRNKQAYNKIWSIRNQLSMFPLIISLAMCELIEKYNSYAMSLVLNQMKETNTDIRAPPAIQRR